MDSKVWFKVRVVVGVAIVLGLVWSLLGMVVYAEGAPKIYLREAELSTEALPSLGAKVLEPYLIVQFRGPILPEWREALEATGAEILDYIPDYAYLVRTRRPAGVLANLPGVRWIGVYRPAYKVASGLLQADEEIVDVRVQVFAGEDPAQVAAKIVSWGGTVRSFTSRKLSGYIRARVPVAALSRLASLPAVSWVGPYHPDELCNDIARRYDVMAVDPVWDGLGLYGTGQIVAVTDTGLDTGDIRTLSDDFLGRVQQAYALGRLGDWSDPDGHGTHVCGSVLGNGSNSGSRPWLHDYKGSYAGVAPEALLVIQSAYVDEESHLGGIPDDYTELFEMAYQDGARIHSNSWGHRPGTEENPYGVYDIGARQVDEFIWWHKDYLVLFAAGNSGVDANKDGVVDLDSIGSPGVAKNVLTVGATENYRPSFRRSYGDSWPKLFPEEPLESDRKADDMDGMAAFSSRGPTDDGRIKPDIVAPGTYILSALSQDAPSDRGWAEYNDYYVYMGGTSMSTPLTAGAAALVRQVYVQRLGVSQPSAALIKATLLNGARNIAPGEYGVGPCQQVPFACPNPVMGWGRVNLRDSIMPISPRVVRFLDDKEGLRTGQAREVVVHVDDIAHGLAGWCPTHSVGRPNLAPLERFRDTFSRALNQGIERSAQVGFCGDILTDGGFEHGGIGWESDGKVELDRPGHNESHYCVWLGGYNEGLDELWQTVDIPQDISDGEISFWLWQTSHEEYPGEYDYFWAGIYSEDKEAIDADVCERDGPAVTDGWIYVRHRLDSEELDDIRGQRVHLAFEVRTNESGHTSVWVDDVRFVICTGGKRLRPNPFRATLVWTDYPGAVEAAKALVNDLDLEVIGPDGRHYYGNNGAQPDRINTVEDVTIVDPIPGDYRIIIRGHNVPMGGAQPYALVVSFDKFPPVLDKHQFLPLVLRWTTFYSWY